MVGRPFESLGCTCERQMNERFRQDYSLRVFLVARILLSRHRSPGIRRRFDRRVQLSVRRGASVYPQDVCKRISRKGLVKPLSQNIPRCAGDRCYEQSDSQQDVRPCRDHSHAGQVARDTCADVNQSGNQHPAKNQHPNLAGTFGHFFMQDVTLRGWLSHNGGSRVRRRCRHVILLSRFASFEGG